MSFEDNYVGRALAAAEGIAARISAALDERDGRMERLRLIEGLAERNLAVRQGILALMKRDMRLMTTAIIDFLGSRTDIQFDGAILALAELNRWSPEPIRSQLTAEVTPFLADPDIKTRQAAIVALRTLNTGGARAALLESLHDFDASESSFLLMELSLTRDASLISSVLKFVCGEPSKAIGTVDKIPFCLAYLVDAEWISKHKFHGTFSLPR